MHRLLNKLGYDYVLIEDYIIALKNTWTYADRVKINIKHTGLQGKYIIFPYLKSTGEFGRIEVDQYE